MASYSTSPPLDDDLLREILEDQRGTSSQTASAPGLSEDSIEQGEALGRVWDRRRRAWIRYRRRRARAAHMNLLDHEGLVLNRDDLLMIGLGLGISIQGLFLAGILGIIMSALGMMTGVATIVKKFMPMADPILDQAQAILDIAKQQGLPIDMLEQQLERQLITHTLPKRIGKYAILTLLGGGAGSFWMSMACVAGAAFAMPSLIQSGFALASGLAFFKHSFEQVADDILSYRFMHHPAVVEERIYETLREYNFWLEKNHARPAQEQLALTATQSFLRSHTQEVGQALATLPIPEPLRVMALAGLSPQRAAPTAFVAPGTVLASAAPAPTQAPAPDYKTLYAEERAFNDEMLNAVAAFVDKVMTHGIEPAQAPTAPPGLQLAMEKLAHHVAFGQTARQAH